MNDNFEQRLQNEAENYRMYPSDKVWDNIRVELHGKPKWPALLITFTSIVIALTVATVINYPPHYFLVKENNTVLAENKVATNTEKKPNTISHKTKSSIEKVVTNIKDIPAIISLNNDLPDAAIANEAEKIVVNEPTENSDIITTNNLQKQQPTTAIATDLKKENNSSTKENITYNESEIAAISKNGTATISPIMIGKKNTDLAKNVDAEKYLNSFKNNSFSKAQKSSKWQVQYYAAATNSYRTLQDDKARLPYINNPVERQALKANVNDVVKHKPALGGEFGVSFLYGLTKNFYLKSGLQFNVRQYGIDAYRSNGNATFSYVANNQLNTFSIQSAYSTQEGLYKAKLEDKLYQISIPVGFQWDIVDGKRWGISTAATIQPTVTLNKDVYVVSTDYKYYADGTNFFRRLNINTGAEVYLTLKSKNCKWFFGPQVRNQQLPTYNDIYPIKEYRVDYGIKFGFVKSLR